MRGLRLLGRLPIPALVDCPAFGLGGRARRLTRRLHGPALALAAALLASCASAPAPAPAQASATEAGESAAPGPRAGLRFAVVADPHVYAPELGTSGPAFEAATRWSRVLYPLSAELLDRAADRLVEEAPDFVLIPGDLTKDGERESHERVLAVLARLRGAGIRAYVLPGNHDLANPRAARLSGDAPERLDSLTPAEFARLYSDYGYGDALSRDAGSLSYSARLAPGLRLVALDPFRYPERPDPRRPDPPAEYGAGTAAWLRAELDAAAREGDAVIAMAHMSLVEHFEGQAREFPDSMASGTEAVARLLASRGARLAFTGHFHVQDATRREFGKDGALLDVATASLASWPLAYRLVELQGSGAARIRTERIDACPSMPAGLRAYAESFLEDRVSGFLASRLEAFGVPFGDAAAVAAAYASAYIGFAGGDEAPAPGAGAGAGDADGRPLGILARLAMSRYASLLRSLRRDLPPEDNDLVALLGR